jgi:hypothetical protein
MQGRVKTDGQGRDKEGRQGRVKTDGQGRDKEGEHGRVKTDGQGRDKEGEQDRIKTYEESRAGNGVGKGGAHGRGKNRAFEQVVVMVKMNNIVCTELAKSVS